MKKINFHRQVNLACQGLITRNNNALELANHFIPRGGLLVERLKIYDRLLSKVNNKGFTHQPGRSLIYLLPFLKAFGATDQRLEEYSTISISLMPGIKTFTIPFFLISSAYQPFIQALAKVIGIEEDEIYYTRVSLDRYPINISEMETLKDLADEIIQMPLISRPQPLKAAILPAYRRRLQIIFEEEIPNMQISRVLTQITALTGHEKVKAIIDSLGKTGNSAEEIIYFGHSALDAAALAWVRDKGGLAVSFNPDRAAIQGAEVAVIADNSVILAILGDVFLKKGKEGVLELVKNWGLNKIQQIPQPFINELFSHESFPQLELVNNSNLERLIGESEYCRRTSFGETI